MSGQKQPSSTDRYAKYDNYDGPGAELADAYRAWHAKRRPAPNNGMQSGGVGWGMGTPRNSKYGDPIRRIR